MGKLLILGVLMSAPLRVFADPTPTPAQIIIHVVGTPIPGLPPFMVLTPTPRPSTTPRPNNGPIRGPRGKVPH
jgi:hypothetical protein